MPIADERPPCPACGAAAPGGNPSCASCSPTTVDPPASQAPTAAAGPDGGRAARYSGPKRVAGYRIIRELGAGGMGTVFEAFEEKMNRKVALKVLARNLSESERASDRFTREAWIAGRLNHPNLVRVFDRGEDEDVSFYSMELLDGGSLHDVLRNLKTWGKDERWGLVAGSREYVTWAIEQILLAARGLDHAHRQGVIHRDIKPMNILLHQDPFAVKLADFGLAVDLGATRMTTAGKVMGTIAYMAPEQIRGQQDLVGTWTDVFALGVTLFEMLTLELPFAGETQQIYMNAVLTSAARRPRKLNERVGRDLETVLEKALEKDPRERYRTVAAFAGDLENVLHFRPIVARPAGRVARLAKWARRRPVHAVLAGVLVVGIPATGLLAARSLQHRRLMQDLRIAEWKEAANHLLHDERFREALTPLDAILRERPADLDSRLDRGLTYARLALAESDTARRGELRALSLQDLGRLVERTPETAWPFRVRAFVLKELGDPAAAAEDERQAARLATPEREFHEIQIDGILAMIAEDYPRAIREFGELIALQPDASDARLWRASVYEDLGDPAKAMTDYEVAAALKPRDILSRLNLARLHTQAGELAEGEALYRKAIELEPGNARAHEGYAANLLEQGRAKAADPVAAADLFRRAEAEARRTLAIDPALPWAHVNLGASLVERNRLEPQPDPAVIVEASAAYEKAIALKEREGGDARDQVYSSAVVNQCDVLIQVGNLDEALRVCRRVADLWPEAAAAHYNLAAVYALSGRQAEAFASLRRDVDLGDRDWEYLASDPWFASLRGDPRLAALLQRMRSQPPSG